MRATFLAHSGFLIEWEHFYTLFDFYQGELPELSPDKPLLVFVSHRHEDHFDSRIFAIPQMHDCTFYYLSRDTSIAVRHREQYGLTEDVAARITKLRPDEIFVGEVAGKRLVVRTIRSTDIGVAFLLSCEGKLVYHAGDLNWWHWTSEGKTYVKHMAQIYQEAIGKLAKAVRAEAEDGNSPPEIALAMVPLDPRLEDGYAMGLDHILDNVAVQHVLPMHMWEKFEIIDRYCKEHPQWAEKILHIRHNGQEFTVD